jgi:hypothetical protein
LLTSSDPHGQGHAPYNHDPFGAGAVGAAYGYNHPVSPYARPAHEHGSAGQSLYTLQGQFEAQFSDPNMKHQRKYPPLLMLMRGKVDPTTWCINITSMSNLVHIFATQGASVLPYELAMGDAAILKFETPRQTPDRTDRVIDLNLEKFRCVVRDHYGKQQPLVVVIGGLSRHAFLLLQLADANSQLAEPAVRSEVYDDMYAWASAYLSLVDRLMELRAHPLIGEECAAAWGLGQVRTAARSPNPPDWSADGSTFTEGKTALLQEAASRSMLSAQKAPASRMSSSQEPRQEPDTKRTKTAPAARPVASAASAASSALASNRSSAAPRPDTTVSHFQTVLDPRTESLRTRPAGLEFCKQFNSGRTCTRADGCRFFHLCTACTADTTKPLSSCHHPQPMCPSNPRL